jgi:hypothetical protein
VDLVTADDVRAKWNAIGLDRQRAAINLLCTVTLLRRGPGRYETPPETVAITWNDLERKDLERNLRNDLESA